MARYLRTYSELSKFETFEERLAYCRCKSSIGLATFGGSRYLNQAFYSSSAWKDVRDKVIQRDNGCDLGIEGRPIMDSKQGIVHHLNSITKEQVLNRDPSLFDPENLILVTRRTHNLIHYGTSEPANRDPVDRRPNDTCPWKGASKC